MTSTRVSVVVPVGGGSRSTADAIARYLETTGFTFEIVTPADHEYGTAVRRGVSEAQGSIIVVADAALPYPVSAIGDAVAMIDSGATDVVFATTPGQAPPRLLEWLLVPTLPDGAVRLAGFSSLAAKVTIGESRLTDSRVELEVAFLANKYGFRVERLAVSGATRSGQRSVGLFSGIAAALRILRANRRNAYRPPRRCPVCFSSEVWTRAQLPAKVVRACRRCKCRYLHEFTVEGDHPVRRVLRGHQPVAAPAYESHSPPARARTSFRRFAWLRRQLPSRGRVLEVGVRDGTFGAAASAEYEYVGIDPASAAARHARSRGLEVYCASLSSFVNTGPAFDAITLFHVFENMPDPHDTLARIKDLLKPGGVLLLSTFDTEGLIYLFSEEKRMAQNFRTHIILYSRSALIELLEHSGFEIIDIGPDFEYRDQKFLRHWITTYHPILARFVLSFLHILPDPLIVTTGSIRIVAKRRSGHPLNARAIRSAEPTHAR